MIPVREVNFLQIKPNLVSLCRSHIGIFIHDMLELIHGYSIGQKLNCTRQVHKMVLFSLLAKKQSHPRPGKKLHAHGMYLSSIGGRPMVFFKREIFAAPNLESMAGFVGQNVNIPTGTVEIGKNIRGFELADVSTIATGGFTIAVDQIHQLGRLHPVKKGICVGT